jgi:plastocyanin
MRSTISLVVAIFLSTAAVAKDAHPPEHMELLREMLRASSSHGPVIPQPESVNPMAAVTINLTAQGFSFTPPEFTVNQNDVVTINVTVPSKDSADGAHGILMDTYIETSLNVSKGQTKSVTFTATTAGEFPFVCPNSSCGIGHSSMFGKMTVNAVVVQPPHINSINPTGGPTTGGTVVTITGVNFNGQATVKFDTTLITNYSVTSSTSITATSPPHAAGAVNIVVTNPDSQSSTLTNGFTYVVPPPPAPTVTSITPDTGPTSGNTPVTITGTNFRAGATVTIGGFAATNVTVVNATTITAMTPLGPATEQLADKDVVVTNSDATTGTLAAGFDYTKPPLAVALITPSASLPGGGSKFSISGAGFTTALPTTITIGGVAATNVQVVDAITITAIAPAHAAGPVDVVVNVGGTAVTAKGSFAYVNSLPKRRSAKH